MSTETDILEQLSTVESEALNWLMLLDAEKELTAKEQLALTEWLSRSPVHREKLRGYNDFWKSNLLNECFLPLQESSIEQSKPMNKCQALFSNQLNKPVLASLLLVCLVTFISFWPGSPEDLKSNGLYSTMIGEQKKVVLDDGSLLHLNTNSQVQVDYNSDARNIWLISGEVHFDVQKNKKKPFRVYAAGGLVEAVGTSFNVYLNKSVIDVLVTEGRIALAMTGTSYLKESLGKYLDFNNIDTQDVSKLNPFMSTVGYFNEGQAISLNTINSLEQTKKSLPSLTKILTKAEIDAQQAWQKGYVVFNGQPLSSVIEEVSRFSQTTFEISDKEIANLRIGGRFKIDNIKLLIVILERDFGLKVDQIAPTVYIISKPEAVIN